MAGRIVSSILAVGVVLHAAYSQADAASPVDDVLVGAIRWDNWRLDSTAGDVLAEPALRDRIPYYAMRLPDGRLGFPGDLEHVLQADVYYARSAGIDYFIFGYYLDTGAWRRGKAKAQALDRAFLSYLNLPDRAGVKFALMFNWSFPPEDVDDVADVILSVAGHPDHVKTANGALPVFMFTPSVEGWTKGLGGEEGAAKALKEIRERVLQASGKRLYITAMLFGIDQGGPQVLRIGFDAISTYANGTGAGGKAVRYSQCAQWARDFWQKGRNLPAGFLPTVTMGWDYRPLLKNPDQASGRDPNPSWCEPATDAQWVEQIGTAIAEARDNPRNARFRSIVLYAWNEFSEGGWIAPTVGEGTRRIAAIATALGRHWGVGSVELRWPASLESPNCDFRANARALDISGGGCAAMSDPLVAEWPCPLGLSNKSVDVRSPSGTEALVNAQAWFVSGCQVDSPTGAKAGAK